MDLYLDLNSTSNSKDTGRLPCQVIKRDDGCVQVWVGSTEGPATMDNMVLAHPSNTNSANTNSGANATVIITSSNSTIMEAVIATSKRLCQRYKRPIMLSISNQPIPTDLFIDDTTTFYQMESSLIKLLDTQLA